MAQFSQMFQVDGKGRTCFKPRLVKILFYVSLIFIFLQFLGLCSFSYAEIREFAGKKYDIAVPGEAVPGEVIVRLSQRVNEKDAFSLARRIQAEVKDFIQEYQLALLRLPLDNSKDNKTQIQDTIWELERFPQVLCAFPNYKLSIPMPVGIYGQKKGQNYFLPIKEVLRSPPGFSKDSSTFQSWQWHLNRIRYSLAGSPASSAPTIAIIDSGVDYEHPDLEGKVILGWDFVEEDADPMDEQGHGTHLAGIIAGDGSGGIMGISPNSKILAVRVLNRMGGGNIFDVIEGIIYARKISGVRILNLSLVFLLKKTESAFSTFKQVIDDTVAQGLLVCAAAGNESNYYFYYQNDSNQYRPVPAWYANSFTIGSTQELDCRSYHSNYNITTYKGTAYNYVFVDVVAPGWNILSTLPGGKYGRMPGTSQACAVAAGAGARIWAAHKGWTVAQVVNRLKSSGRLINEGTNGFYTPAYRLNLMKAMGRKKTGFVGIVYNGQNGQPLPGVTVKAIAGGAVKAKSISNNSGFFTIKGVKAGTVYKLNFEKKGFIAFTYPKLKAVAKSLVDLDMPVFLPQVRPSGQWSLLITWHSWHPGRVEGMYVDPGPNWSLIKWNETHGAQPVPIFQGSVWLNFLLNPVLDVRGDLTEEPYAALTQDSLFNTVPLHCIVISRQNDRPCLLSCWLDKTNWVTQGYPTWGNYKRKRTNLRAYLYYGASLKNVVYAKKAKGQGPIWRIAEITGKKVKVINRLEEGRIY